MVAINSKTRAAIKGYLEGFIKGLIDEYKGREILKPVSAREYLSRYSSNGELKPFQAAIIPPELIRINQFERGLSTRLGNSLVNKKQEKPNLRQMITAVLNARRSDDLEKKVVRADLYILAKDSTKFLFEIKATKPNKGQCLEVLQRLLRFHLLLDGNQPQIQAYYAMPYNPYGVNTNDYKWTHAKKYLPFDEAVVIGNDFWNIIGGATTYEELLEIYLEVGREKSKYMLDALAFGF